MRLSTPLANETELGAPAPVARVANLRRVPLDALTGEELEAWHRLRIANPCLDSPYFHPGFAAAVHRSGRSVEVVLGRDEQGEIRALLPTHRDGGLLRPAGWPGADFQGPVLAPHTVFPPLKLLVGGVRRFAFDHLLDTYPDFVPWVESTRPSPYADTSGGLDGYLGRASRSGKDNMGQARRRAAKAEREYGTLRFAADAVDDEAMRRVVELKRAQYAASGVRDFFAEPNRLSLLSDLLHTRDAEFGGVLSTVYAGEHLIAAHFGLRAGSVLHWWFPVYDPAFAALSPGWILLRELVAASPRLGIKRIDFGRGDDEYKRRAKTGETWVCQGMVTRSAFRRTVRRGRNRLIDAASSSALAPGLRRVVRIIRGINR